MEKIRPPAVAGAFYNSQKQRLQNDVNALLQMARSQAEKDNDGAPDNDTNNRTSPKALIVPHAGYIYSGQTAAAAYVRLSAVSHTIKRVILLGPVHRVAVRGLALPEASAFATPLGEIQLDQNSIAAIEKLPQVVVSPAVHADEHSLEVQLPFLQSVLDDFQLVPLAVGDATAEEVAEVLDILWGGPETLIVISSDLSHFLPYHSAKTVDAETVDNILKLDGGLSHKQACGGTPVNGFILAARQHHLQPHLLDLRNSGDTAGDKSRVVGYASFAFNEESAGANYEH